MDDPEQHYVRRHVDDKDIQFQYAIVLGDGVTGGDLRLWNTDGSSQTINYLHKVVKMDGRLPHEVLPFTGTRFCVIFYKLDDRQMNCAAPIYEPASIVADCTRFFPPENP